MLMPHGWLLPEAHSLQAAYLRQCEGPQRVDAEGGAGQGPGVSNDPVEWEAQQGQQVAAQQR